MIREGAESDVFHWLLSCPVCCPHYVTNLKVFKYPVVTHSFPLSRGKQHFDKFKLHKLSCIISLFSFDILFINIGYSAEIGKLMCTKVGPHFYAL